MICPNCNREIPDGSNICGYCSYNLRDENQGYQQYRPQQSGFAMTGGSTKITKRGLIVIGAAILVVILLIWLIWTLFNGNNNDPNQQGYQPAPQTTALNYPLVNETATPEGYGEAEATIDPLMVNPITAAPTATPAPTDMPVFETLKRGSEDTAAVTMLQTRLKYFGYLTGDVDGQYGPATSEAVKAFQQSAGITADGVAGPETLTRLYSLEYDENAAATNLDAAPGAQTEQLNEKPDIPG